MALTSAKIASKPSVKPSTDAAPPILCSIEAKNLLVSGVKDMPTLKHVATFGLPDAHASVKPLLEADELYCLVPGSGKGSRYVYAGETHGGWRVAVRMKGPMVSIRLQHPTEGKEPPSPLQNMFAITHKGAGHWSTHLEAVDVTAGAGTYSAVVGLLDAVDPFKVGPARPIGIVGRGA